MKFNKNIFMKKAYDYKEDFENYNHNETINLLIALYKKETRLRFLASSPFMTVFGAGVYFFMAQYSTDTVACILSGVMMGLISYPTIFSALLQSFPKLNFLHKTIHKEVTTQKNKVLQNLIALCKEQNFQVLLLSYFDNLISNFYHYNRTHIVDDLDLRQAVQLSNFKITLVDYLANNKIEEAVDLLMNEHYLYIIRHADKCATKFIKSNHSKTYNEQTLKPMQNESVLSYSDLEVENEISYTKYL